MYVKLTNSIKKLCFISEATDFKSRFTILHDTETHSVLLSFYIRQLPSNQLQSPLQHVQIARASAFNF